MCLVLLAPTEQFSSPPSRTLFSGAYTFKPENKRERKDRTPQSEAGLSHATTHGSWTLHPLGPISSLMATVTSLHGNFISRGQSLA